MKQVNDDDRSNSSSRKQATTTARAADKGEPSYAEVSSPQAAKAPSVSRKDAQTGTQIKPEMTEKSVHKPVSSTRTTDADSDSASELNAYPTSSDRRSSVSTPSTGLRRHRPNQVPLSQSAFQPVQQSSDRIAIFIDGSNLFYAASHLNIEVDYRRLLTTLVRGRRLLRAYFYTGVDPQNEKQRGFLLWLNRHGHRVVSKELAQLPDGSRKANMHVEMAVDMMRISEYCSTLTLLGGDGNLAYALQVLSQRGTSIEVVSLQSMTSDSLIDLADAYTDLADLKDEIKR